MKSTTKNGLSALAAAVLATMVGVSVSDASRPGAQQQQAELRGLSVLPAATLWPGSPPSGAFLTDKNRADALANHLSVPSTGTIFDDQPIQGISSVIPARGGGWWALADNGYGTRETSADWQLAVYLLDPVVGSTAKPTVRQRVVLSDPARKVPWQTVCDPTNGTPLPPLSFNKLPTTPPPACGSDPKARVLTGFDFDPESIELGADGTFWIGDEFGPFLLHADRQGRLLDRPIAVPGVKSPQNPTLDVAGGEKPTVAASRGFESLAINPSRDRLYAMFEGVLSTDDPQDVRIETFDIKHRRFTGQYRKVRLEMPGAKVDLTKLTLAGGTTLAYKNSLAPTGTGGESVSELTALDSHRFLLLERDGNGDGLAAPRLKKVFVIDTARADHNHGYVDKQIVVDLMAIPDPRKVADDQQDFFNFPFNTVESVHVVDDHTIIVANDNNYPFSNGRARSRSADRSAPLAPDDNEFILIGVSMSLHPDHRLTPVRS